MDRFQSASRVCRTRPFASAVPDEWLPSRKGDRTRLTGCLTFSLETNRSKGQIYPGGSAIRVDRDGVLIALLAAWAHDHEVA